ncbi:hypothetical protein TWF103_005599 [Orbilia oligospora]|nr:hypothetical protein TWF103_005599 [Orbilia oligospora]
MQGKTKKALALTYTGWEESGAEQLVSGIENLSMYLSMYLGTRHQYGIISYPFCRWIEGPGTSAGRLNHAYSPQVCIYIRCRDIRLLRHHSEFQFFHQHPAVDVVI